MKQKPNSPASLIVSCFKGRLLWKGLYHYLEDGRLEIDNNLLENAILELNRELQLAQ